MNHMLFRDRIYSSATCDEADMHPLIDYCLHTVREQESEVNGGVNRKKKKLQLASLEMNRCHAVIVQSLITTYQNDWKKWRGLFWRGSKQQRLIIQICFQLLVIAALIRIWYYSPELWNLQFANESLKLVEQFLHNLACLLF